MPKLALGNLIHFPTRTTLARIHGKASYVDHKSTTTSPRWINQLAGFQEKGFMCPLIPMRASHRQRPFLHTRTDKQVDLDPMFHSPFT
jgi:hypothetical protein